MMQVGLGIKPGSDGTNLVILEATSQTISIAIALTDETNYETDIDNLVKGLQDIKREMRRIKSGLVVVKGGNDDGLRNPQGRKQHRPSSKSTQGA